MAISQPIAILVVPFVVLELLQILAVEAVAHREANISCIDEVVAL